MKQLELIVEKADDGYQGSVYLGERLIIKEAASISQLEAGFRKILKDKVYAINPDKIVFVLKYDISAVFRTFSYLKISSIASLADINAGLLRQYVSGVKYPTLKQAQKIEGALHQIAKDLLQVRVHASYLTDLNDGS